jgi:hypothetical protein
LGVLCLLAAGAAGQVQQDIFAQLGHVNEVLAVAFSPDGRTALSGSWDDTLKLWDVATGRELRTFSGHSDKVASVAFSPDGRTAVAVKLRQDLPPFGLVINGCEEVNRFIDAADLGHGLCQPGRTVANLEGAHNGSREVHIATIYRLSASIA